MVQKRRQHTAAYKFRVALNSPEALLPADRVPALAGLM